MSNLFRPPTGNQYTRDQMISAIRDCVINQRRMQDLTSSPTAAESIKVRCDVLEATVAVLEAYPLTQFKAEAVKIFSRDLASRDGFADLIAQNPTGWLKIEQFLLEQFDRKCVYVDPLQPTIVETLDFDLPVDEPPGSDLDF